MLASNVLDLQPLPQAVVDVVQPLDFPDGKSPRQSQGLRRAASRLAGRTVQHVDFDLRQVGEQALNLPTTAGTEWQIEVTLNPLLLVKFGAAWTYQHNLSHCRVFSLRIR